MNLEWDSHSTRSVKRLRATCPVYLSRKWKFTNAPKYLVRIYFRPPNLLSWKSSGSSLKDAFYPAARKRSGTVELMIKSFWKQPNSTILQEPETLAGGGGGEGGGGGGRGGGGGGGGGGGEPLQASFSIQSFDRYKIRWTETVRYLSVKAFCRIISVMRLIKISLAHALSSYSNTSTVFLN